MPASGHMVRGVNERGSAINQGLNQIQNCANINLILRFECFFELFAPGSLFY